MKAMATSEPNWIVQLFRLLWRLIKGLVGAMVAGVMGFAVSAVVVAITGRWWLFEPQAAAWVKLGAGLIAVVAGTLVAAVIGMAWPAPFLVMLERFDRARASLRSRES